MILVIVTFSYSTRTVSRETTADVNRRSCGNETILIGDPVVLFVDAVRSPMVVHSLLIKEDHTSDAQPCPTLPDDWIHL